MAPAAAAAQRRRAQLRRPSAATSPANTQRAGLPWTAAAAAAPLALCRPLPERPPRWLLGGQDILLQEGTWGGKECKEALLWPCMHCHAVSLLHSGKQLALAACTPAPQVDRGVRQVPVRDTFVGSPYRRDSQLLEARPIPIPISIFFTIPPLVACGEAAAITLLSNGRQTRFIRGGARHGKLYWTFIVDRFL